MPTDAHAPDASNPGTEPEQDQHSAAIDAEDTTTTTVSTHETDEPRTAEAGNAYVGRTMDDALKSSPRVEGSGTGEDPQAPDDASSASPEDTAA